MSIFSIGAILVGLSALFGVVNHRVLRLPHTIGLVVIALVASLVIIAIDRLDPSLGIGAQVTGVLKQIDFNETLMHGMLSFMLFAGALHADFSALRTRRLVIAVMAVVGTFVSTFTVAALMWWIAPWVGLELPFIWALVFGALISPTDPVAVLGLFKTVKVPATLQAKMAGESLFNDGVGVVVFTVVVAIALGGSGIAPAAGGHAVDMDALEIAKLFLGEVAGGVVLGLVGGYICYRAMHGIDEPALEVLITLAGQDGRRIAVQ